MDELGFGDKLQLVKHVAQTAQVSLQLLAANTVIAVFCGSGQSCGEGGCGTCLHLMWC